MLRVTTLDEPTPTDALLEQLPQLRRLARGLMRDAADADDLLQSTVTVALREPPRIRAAWRSWLARVMTNLARQQARSRWRRELRERVVAPNEALESTGALIERHDVRLHLMQAVRGLDEPYRETILLRFFEDLPPRAIAMRLGVPVKTVDSRLARGLAKLREHLDLEHGGDRRGWLLALVPLARAAPVPLTLAGVLAMKSVTISVGVATILCTSWLLLRDDSSRVVDSPAPAAVVASETQTVTAPAEAPQDVARTVTQSGAPAPEDRATDTPTLSGRVLGLDGEPIGNVRLAAAPQGGTGRGIELWSDAAGRFALPWQDVAQDVICVDPRYVTVLEAAVQRASPDVEPFDVVVIVAAVTRVDGMAVDANGTPVPGATIELAPPPTLRARFPFDLSGNRVRTLNATTDAAGRFVFESAPAVVDSTCAGTKTGYVGATAVLTTFPSSDLRLTLERPSDQATLQGIVFDPAGAPLPGAHLALGQLPTRSDEHGRFTFEYPRTPAPDRLFAVAKGLQALTLERPGTEWPPFVELRFLDAAPSIAGIVYGPSGEPQADARVWIDRPTVFGQSNGNFWVAELVTHGSTSLQHGTTTDERGQFRIEGLVDREYGLCAMIPELAWQIEAGRAHAGDERVEIRFPKSGIHPTLHGRVVDGRGAAVAGAKVFVSAMLLAAEDPVSTQRFYNVATGSEATTEADGRFVLSDVPIGSELEVHGVGLELDPAWVVPEIITDAITLQVGRICKFRVELTSFPQNAASVALRDAQDHEVPMTRWSPALTEVLQHAPLADGKSEQLTALDRAVTLVVLDAQHKELQRSPITLDPAELTIVR